jgi:hypothetical protein
LADSQNGDIIVLSITTFINTSPSAVFPITWLSFHWPYYSFLAEIHPYMALWLQEKNAEPKSPFCIKKSPNVLVSLSGSDKVKQVKNRERCRGTFQTTCKFSVHFMLNSLSQPNGILCCKL